MKQTLPYTPIGKYNHYDICRFCLSNKLSLFLNLGNVPLAGGFLKSAKYFEHELFYPLEISFCQNCYLVQSTNVIDKDTLFQDYFYHSSSISTLKNHFTEIAKELAQTFSNPSKSFVVEIGCNDGTLIKQLSQNKIKALGVDPATNIVTPLMKKGMPIINDYFSEKVAKKIVKEHGKADVICSFNVLAHIEDMHDIVKGIKVLLKKDGSLMFETHYLSNVLNEMQYDMIYHEHQYYYSLMTLQKFFAQYDMEIYDVRAIPIHAGSMRYYVQNKGGGKHKISHNVRSLIKEEKTLQFDKLDTYLTYAKKIEKTKHDLLKLLTAIKKEDKTIVGYGASGRGTTIMNYCGLDETFLDYVIDDAPAKQGAYTPGTHMEIKSSKVLEGKNKPDYVILFAWSFFEEIKKKNKKYLENGGTFIVPLPKVKIIY